MVVGIVSAVTIINNSFEAWKDAPVITSVIQIPIESVPFPSVTICPMERNRYIYVSYFS